MVKAVHNYDDDDHSRSLMDFIQANVYRPINTSLCLSRAGTGISEAPLQKHLVIEALPSPLPSSLPANIFLRSFPWAYGPIFSGG